MVISPSAMLKKNTMSLRSVTCTQDNESGTRTTLDLVAPWMLEDTGGPGQGTGAVPNAPG
jgi:hypothetical protein